VSRGWKIAFGLVALALIVGGGFLAQWVTHTRKASLPALPVSTVPASWREFRLGRGHVVHVKQKGFPCATCHAAGSFSKPDMNVCVGCHAARATMKHGLHGDALQLANSVANCADCHAFGPKDHGRAGEPWACLDCHAQPQGTLHAVTTHADQECKQCHHPHDTPAIEPLACLSCHAKAHNAHAPKLASGPQNCLSCHQAHAPASVAAERCTQCHDDKPHALFASGHERCTDCHQPHDFGVKEVKNCRSCHRDQHVLGEDNPRAKHSCTNCHDPHAAQAGASDATCRNCHAQIEPQHPEVKGQSCLTCHVPHPKASNAPVALACTSCHQQAANDQSAHAGKAECTSCHAPHAFAHPAQPQTCQSCHAVQLTATAKNPGHGTCAGCHRGDIHGADLKPVACGTCHTNVHPRAEHAECTKCHEPHSGAPRPLEVGCASCHAAEVRSVRTQHQDCLTCHTPHEGARRADAPCVSCHEAKAQQNHANLPGGCTQCHAIHGATQKGLLDTPACTTCHSVDKLPGLHASPAHQQCKSCHESGHDPGPFSERQTCTQCHKKQIDHQPDATLCQGCHVFRK
jgi:hypothetical protein